MRLGRLVKAYAKGDYRDVSKKNIALIVAALLYFISPLDLIPDAIPILGFMDDMAVIGFILSTLGEELLKYESFEEVRQSQYAQRSFQDLMEEATERDVPGRNGMSKQELAEALSKTV